MSALDKPKIHATLKDLDNEVRQEPFTYMTKANKRVVFPDPGEMDWEDSEQFTRDLSGPMPAREFLEKYLGDEGFAALAEERFTGYQMTAFMKKVVTHYGAFFGTEEKERASRS